MRRPPSALALLVLSSGLARADIPELPGPSAAIAAPPVAFEPAPVDARRLPLPADAHTLMGDLDAWFAATPGRRIHVELDRPLYRPGDPVQVKVWDLKSRGLAAGGGTWPVQLVDPRGTVQGTTSAVTASGGGAKFTLAADAPGGSWVVRVQQADGTAIDRPFVVASFQAPRIKKTLDFARDGYRPGDAVEAAVTFERATGERLANVAVTARVLVDGVAQPDQVVRTDAKGAATVRFVVPADLQHPDVALTVTVDDGGATESISRPVPVVLDEVHLSLFPEGGALVRGIPGRVYFEATDANGEPADVTGELVDDRDRVVGAVASWVDGRGRFTLTPEAGRSYRVRLAEASFDLPAAVDQGCVLHTYDDLDGTSEALRVGVACSDDREVVVLATQQEQIVDRALVRVAAGRPTTVYLKSADPALAGAQGVARVTVLDRELQPLAERLTYRNRARPLGVTVTPDRERYAPGDPVRLTVHTTDPEGHGVPAELALSVVDDALLSYADDHQPDLRARVLLQADLPDPIEGAAEWFDRDRADGGLAVDLALGTRGWRRFDWTPVRGYLENVSAIQASIRGGWRMGGGRGEGMRNRGPYPGVAPASVAVLDEYEAADDLGAPVEIAATGMAMGGEEDDRSKVAKREFAAPVPTTRHDEPASARSDFRDALVWEPALHTDASGTATVKFALDDSVTGFRATAEGVGRGLVGKGDALLTSSLPFHVEARLPVELSSGDRVLVPVTVENQRPETVAVKLGVAVSVLVAGEPPAPLSLGAGERRTVMVPLTAGDAVGQAELSLTAKAGTLSDAVVQTIPVAPKGFPRGWTGSGTLEGRVEKAVRVPDPVPGSVRATLTVYPSPVAEILQGVESMVHEPGGCFEQTSSGNYPNVVILDLLDRSGAGGKLSVDRQHVLQTGYSKLTGYQVEQGGFETWGSGPGKEALSAYGLLEFTAMSRVFPVDPHVIDGDVAYLYHQRTGKGGYQVSGASAHGYGTAPPEVLDAYITWALVETGHRDLPAEIDQQSTAARKTSDPYRLALATLTLLAARPDEGKAAAARLAGLQAGDGSFPGAETSITRSESQNLLVETNALAMMAMSRAGNFGGVDRALRWFQDHQSGPGVWGATQGNALALTAIGEVTREAGKGPGAVAVTVDGKPAGTLSFAADSRDPVVLDLGSALTGGTHTVGLSLADRAVPYTLDVRWTTLAATDDPTRRVDLATHLSATGLKMGDTARLTAKLTNRTQDVVPDPIARIGLPAGLVAQTWQLQALKDRGEIAFFETRPREVTVYWDGIAAGEVHEVALDLVAQVPGTFTGPPSQAYPYYDDQARAWAPGLPVDIRP